MGAPRRGGWWRGLRAVALGVVLTLGLTSAPFVAPTVTAAALPVWDPVIEPAARPAWGFLEDEARQLLANRGIPNDVSALHARELIRSYVFVRILGLITQTTRTPQEQAAFSYLQQQVHQGRVWTATNALRKHNDYRVEQLNCPAVGAIYPEEDSKCLFQRMFGNTPSARAFMAAGQRETFRGYNEPTAAGVLADAVNGIGYWRGLEPVPADSPEEATFAGFAKDLLDETISDTAMEMLEGIVSALVDIALREATAPEDWALMAVAGAAVLAYGIWNAVDSFDTTTFLKNAVTAAQADTAPDLTSLTKPAGMTELLMVVLSQTMPMEFSTRPCSFQPSTAGAQPVQCQMYAFGAEADKESARYPAGVPSPAHGPADPYFALQVQGQGPSTLSATVERSSRHRQAWRISNEDGTSQLRNPTTVRGISGTAVGGITSFVHDGLAITTWSSYGGADETRWRASAGIRYVDWRGDWWNAWLDGTTFRHNKVAEAITGTFTPGSEVTNVGHTGCIENPQAFAQFDLLDVRGPDCLFASKDADLSRVKPGDELLVAGQIRVVEGIVPCDRFELFDAWPTCTEFGPRAIKLKPGETTQWVAFDSLNIVLGILGFPSFPVKGSSDSQVMKLVRLDTCLGRTGCTTPTDSANCAKPADSTAQCFVGPSIEFREGEYTNQVNMRATLVAPLTAVSDDYTADANGPDRSGVILDSALSVTGPAGVLANDISTTGAGLAVVRAPQRGTLAIAPDGGFSYRPHSGFGATSPQVDTFRYQICRSDLPAWTRSCDEADVSITVRNAPPTAAPVAVGSSTITTYAGSRLSITSYTYTDREGDREGVTRYQWMRDGVAIPGQTGRTYIVGPADVGRSINAVVTPVALTGTTEGTPAQSAGKVVSGAQTASSPVSSPTFSITCDPATVPYGSLGTVPSTCTARLTARSDRATFGTVAPKFSGSVAFRTQSDGRFAPSSCSPSVTKVDTTSSNRYVNTSWACAVAYTPTTDGSHPIVATARVSLEDFGSVTLESRSAVAVVGGPVPVAPAFVQRPADVTVPEGSAATFTASASGVPTPGAQWLASSDRGVTFVPIPGATSPTLTLTNVTLAMSGNQFAVGFTNAAGTVGTVPATLTVTPVGVPPVITQQPANVSVLQGAAASFTAAASGNPTPTIAWSRSTDQGVTWTVVPGATATILSLASVALAQSGDLYRATFTNSAGTIDSATATLTVTVPGQPPVLTAAPGDIVVPEGSTATFVAAATGEPAVTAAWLKSTDRGVSWTVMPGETSPTLTIANTKLSQSGELYRAGFLNSLGSVTSTVATLTVTPVGAPPVLTQSPTSVVTTPGVAITLSAAATGTPVPTAAWLKSTDNGATWSVIAGETNPTLVLASLTLADSGTQYRAGFVNPLGSVTSTAATVTVAQTLSAGPVITLQPTDARLAKKKGTATFTAAAVGVPEPTVQWQIARSKKKWKDIPGATTTALTLTSARKGTRVRAVFTNSAGIATTQAAKVVRASSQDSDDDEHGSDESSSSDQSSSSDNSHSSDNSTGGSSSGPGSID